MSIICSLLFPLLRAAEKSGGAAATATVTGEVLDAETSRPIPARLYVEGSDHTFHFAKSAAAEGSAIPYERRRTNTTSVEMHTTLTAHPFQLQLSLGRYTVTVARGKEYHAETREVSVTPGMAPLNFRLRRWTNMAKAGWYSGDTHVHREPAELANVMLAEDLNVALPTLDWTADSRVAPTASPKSSSSVFRSAPVIVDATHVWHPRNTEYEITRTEKPDHRLGAFLILNHRTRFDRPALPLREVARKVRAEGALLDLEKHNWPWSLALVPVLKIDLFELANNHHWQAEYAVKNWAVPAPAWMQLSGTGTDTERDWTLYGFHTYYALLNCGFRLRPSAGTANGVHPVPLGFSRVYVQLDEPFSHEAWMRGLAAGRSFVTTGPMLQAKVADRWPGADFMLKGSADEFPLECVVQSEHPLARVELIENGEIVQTFEPANQPDGGAFRSEITLRHRPTGSSWIAWRCFEERLDGRIRFAHTAPWHFNKPGQPLRPRKAEADWLVARVKEEIARSRGAAPHDLIADYEQALALYEKLAATAR